MNDAKVLQKIQGHENIVGLIEVIPEGTVDVAESGVGSHKLHVDYAMAIECIKGGELYFNMEKFGSYTPKVAHYFFRQIVDAIAHMH
jgi:serine/threonine protein kinase